MKRPKKPITVEPVPVNYRYAFNTEEEVAVLVAYYTRKIGTLASPEAVDGKIDSTDLIIKFVDRIKFLEEQLRMPKSSKF